MAIVSFGFSLIRKNSPGADAPFNGAVFFINLSFTHQGNKT
jgi:hypothetical protein